MNSLNVAMATSRRSCHTILLLCLAVAFCEAKLPVPAGPDTFRGSSLRKHDLVDPLATVFNVMQYGAKPNGRADNTQVN